MGRYSWDAACDVKPHCAGKQVMLDVSRQGCYSDRTVICHWNKMNSNIRQGLYDVPQDNKCIAPENRA